MAPRRERVSARRLEEKNAVKNVKEVKEVVAPEKTEEKAVVAEVKPVEEKVVEAPVVAEETVPAVQPKKRGRKPKAETQAAAPAAEPKKRGRKPKAETQAAAATATKEKEHVVLQFTFGEYSVEDVVEMCKKAYASENKTKIKNIDVYVKPADQRAYYVVNDKVAGSVEL